MTDGKLSDDSPPALDMTKAGKRAGTSTAGQSPPGSDSAVTGASDPDNPKQLTKEEQMALYEKDLRENDWGHQPC